MNVTGNLTVTLSFVSHNISNNLVHGSVSNPTYSFVVFSTHCVYICALDFSELLHRRSRTRTENAFAFSSNENHRSIFIVYFRFTSCILVKFVSLSINVGALIRATRRSERLSFKADRSNG